MGHRRKSREYALQALYMYDTVNEDIDSLCSLSWLNKELSEEVKEFAGKLIRGTIGKIDYIDDLIKQFSRNWKFERLGVIDKSVLRMSIYSLLYLKEIPEAVTINEGVELGKKYGGENSGQFINGILDAIKNSELFKEGSPGSDSEK